MAKETSIKKILIIGAGTVGRHLVQLLQREAVDVVLIDQSAAALQEAGENFDVQTICGNGASPEILERANVSRTELVLSLTDSCEVNLLSAFIAKQMGASKTVARTRAPWSLDVSRVNLPRSLSIDLLLNPEHLTAIEIARFLDNPAALAMTHFAHGKVQLRQFVLDEKTTLAGLALKDCSGRMPSGVLAAMCVRDGKVSIPKGSHVMRAGDKLTLIGSPNRLDEAQRLFQAPSPPVRKIVIAGGGHSGLFLAEALESKNFQVRIVDPDPGRCEYLSERLEHATVVRGDATRLGFLQEERIGESDVFIAVMGNDEDNLMACLLAKEQGVKQTVARMDRPDYASLVQKMGIDLALSPRHVIADRIMALVLGGRIKAISLMEEGRVEAIEFIAREGTPVVDRPLSQVGADLPDGALISAIVRHGHATIPGGEDIIRPGDTVVAIGLSEQMNELEAMFQER